MANAPASWVSMQQILTRVRTLPASQAAMAAIVSAKPLL
jgi:hypothetical protein